MKRTAPPIATYRLQFNREFTFASARRMVPYLHRLGISHVYASPVLKSRANSPHGYDIVDHNSLNPELGSYSDFEHYIDALRGNGMGQILDIVPNHMGVWFADNKWWLDVLENGEASRYASYFDIDWHPTNSILRNKVLVPCLGNHYGAVLEAGELKLDFDPATGQFVVRYGPHLLPIDPRTYPQILDTYGEHGARGTVGDRQALKLIRPLADACAALPKRTELALDARRRRRRGAAECKAALAELYRHRPLIVELIHRRLRSYNGTLGKAASFDRLHRLLESQAYRLTYWLVASDEVNYRRFFDINDLAGIRMDHAEVFRAAHRCIYRLIANGQIDGLRIDHFDGLADPLGYLQDLQRLIGRAAPHRNEAKNDVIHLIIEKILATGEHLPLDWPVSGTSGYEVARLINGVLIDPEGSRPLQRIYNRFVGQKVDFDELLYRCKKLIIRTTLAGELTVLANRASSIAQTDRRTRDFTYLGLREAITEIVACFPIYRTYLTANRSGEHDHRVLQWAIAKAKRRSHAKDVLIFDFLGELLNLRASQRHTGRIRREMVRFVLRFQQYTAPVMAKGLEDTAFYSYNLLLSLNDVGFDPRRFSVSCDTFHRANIRRWRNWPHSMVCTSTHDSKRSEDVRARVNVLSELPMEWRRHLFFWRRSNRAKKRNVDGFPAPSPNDEYLLYQTLIGTWPVEPLDDAVLAGYRDRVAQYMLKAVREAKIRSSWINSNTAYEEATRQFVFRVLRHPARNPFLVDLISFQRRILEFGLLNGLSQALLKLTVPGFPDLYQGNEMWTFWLADPDNRRPVDHSAASDALEAMRKSLDQARDRRALLAELLTHIEDGRAKLYLTWRALRLRQAQPRLFVDGDYRGLPVKGTRAEHICAYTRSHRSARILVAAPRWFARLSVAAGKAPLDPEVWSGTWVQCPGKSSEGNYRDVLSGKTVSAVRRNASLWFDAVDLFRHFPVALLSNR